MTHAERERLLPDLFRQNKSRISRCALPGHVLFQIGEMLAGLRSNPLAGTIGIAAAEILFLIPDGRRPLIANLTAMECALKQGTA